MLACRDQRVDVLKVFDGGKLDDGLAGLRRNDLLFGEFTGLASDEACVSLASVSDAHRERRRRAAAKLATSRPTSGFR